MSSHLCSNVDFNNAGLLGSTSTIPFGDLVLTNLPAFDGALNGLTVEQADSSQLQICVWAAALVLGWSQQRRSNNQ